MHPAPCFLLRAHRDAHTTASFSASLATTAFTAFGCNWQVDTELAGAHDHIFRLTLVSGACPPISAGLLIDLPAWSTEVYTVFPGALYAGNRFGCRPQNYSPRYPEADARPDAATLVTDLPRLSLSSKVSSRVQQLTGDLAAPVFAARWPDGATVLVSAPDAPANALWEISEFTDRSAATFALLTPGVRETRYSFASKIQTDFPSEDRGRVLKAGECIELRFHLHTFTTPDLAALFERLFALHARQLAAVPARHELPLSAAYDLIEAKRNREDWAGDIGLYRTTNLNPGQSTNVFQTGWCGGILAESALLAGTPESAGRARRSLDTLAAGAPRPTGWLAGKCHADGSWSADFVHDIARPYTHDWTLVRRQADALFYLLAAAERHTGLTGEPAPAAWTHAARGLADAFTKVCDRHLSPGHFIDIDTGEIRVGNSASGALAPAALCAAAKRFNRPEYLHTAAALGAYYHEHYTAKGFSTGGPADAMQAPDSESSAGLVESFLALHEADAPGGPWLDRARDAAAQLASWVMPYDYPFPADSEFGRLGMPTVGSVFANAQNKHSAPGLCTHSGLSLFRLFRHTGDVRLLRLVAAIARFLPWCVSRDDRPIHAHERRALPSGWINERVNTSDWDHNLGGVFYGSTWSEVSLLLTAVELPSVYAQPDTGLLVSLDHVDAAWTSSDHTAIRIGNPTQFPARVRLFAETQANASAHVFGPAAAGALPVHAIAPGATLEIDVVFYA